MDSVKDLKEILLPSVDPKFFSSAHAWEREERSPIEKGLIKDKRQNKKIGTKSNKKQNLSQHKSIKNKKKPKSNSKEVERSDSLKDSETTNTVPYKPVLVLATRNNTNLNKETKGINSNLQKPIINTHIQNKIIKSPKKVLVSEMNFDFDWATEDVEMDYSIIPIFK